MLSVTPQPCPVHAEPSPWFKEILISSSHAQALAPRSLTSQMLRSFGSTSFNKSNPSSWEINSEFEVQLREGWSRHLCASPTWSLNNMSDFHQLCLAFWPRASRTIHHNVSALRSCHCASWAGTTKCNNWREISSSKLQLPNQPRAPPLPTSQQQAPFCPGLLVSSLHFCVLHVWRDKG